MNRKSIRKAFNKIHLWLGLASGVVLFLVCASGTVYTFKSEIERWLEPEKYYADVKPGEKLLPADTIVARIEQKLGGKVSSVLVPGDETMNWQIGVKKEVKDAVSPAGGGVAEGDGGGREKKPSRPKSYFINPYTAEIAGAQGGATSEFFTRVMRMHRWLMLENSVGRIIVGIATIIFVIMIISGLVLWFPARLRNWKQGVTIKTKAGWKRINHDLHYALGFYSFLILLIMALTGLCWSFEWYRNGMSDVLGAKVFKGRTEKPLSSGNAETSSSTASLSLLLSETNKVLNYPGNLRLTIAEEKDAAVVVSKSATGFFAISGADKLQFDRHTGEILRAEAFSGKPLNVKIADSIKAIHTGEIFGTFSKIIYFLVCLMATSLPVTGTIIWLNKMKKTKKKPRKILVAKQEQFA